MKGEIVETIDDEQYTRRLDRWALKTAAQILREDEFLKIKEGEHLYVAGFAGFAGKWKREGMTDDETQKIESNVREAVRSELNRLAEEAKEKGKTLIVASGATNAGVLEVVYSECKNMRIKAMGVTTDVILRKDFPVGEMQYLISYGDDWGMESKIFTDIIDELVVVGGGKQSAKEAEVLLNSGRPVTVKEYFKTETEDRLLALPGVRKI